MILIGIGWWTALWEIGALGLWGRCLQPLQMWLQRLRLVFRSKLAGLRGRRQGQGSRCSGTPGETCRAAERAGECASSGRARAWTKRRGTREGPPTTGWWMPVASPCLTVTGRTSDGTQWRGLEFSGRTMLHQTLLAFGPSSWALHRRCCRELCRTDRSQGIASFPCCTPLHPPLRVARSPGPRGQALHNAQPALLAGHTLLALLQGTQQL